MAIRTRSTPREVIEAMADALGRETWTGFNLGVDLEPKGKISHERTVRIAKLARRLGVLEARGYVAATMDRNGKQVGWRLTDKGVEASRKDVTPDV